MRRRADATARKELARAGSGNRLQRKHDANRGGRRFFHGTTAALADVIRREGLRPGRDGRCYLTDSRYMAGRYASWATALAATVDGSWHPTSDVGKRAAAMGGPVAVIVHCRLPPSVVVHEEHRSSCPPLPWESTAVDGTAFFVAQPIEASMLVNFELQPLPEFEDAATLDLVRRESELIAATFRRNHAAPDARAPSAVSDFKRDIPEPGDLIAAVVAGSPNAGSMWHGENHWRGVAAAGARVLEAGCPADPAVLFAFALLHDSQRHAEGRDREHGQRAADLVPRLGGAHSLDDSQLAVLQRALVDHDRGLTSDDLTIGACWDSDRLTLGRVGVTPRAELLSTAAGRALLDTPDRIPAGEACDWSWVVFRFQLSGAFQRLEIRNQPEGVVT